MSIKSFMTDAGQSIKSFATNAYQSATVANIRETMGNIQGRFVQQFQNNRLVSFSTVAVVNVACFAGFQKLAQTANTRILAKFPTITPLRSLAKNATLGSAVGVAILGVNVLVTKTTSLPMSKPVLATLSVATAIISTIMLTKKDANFPYSLSVKTESRKNLSYVSVGIRRSATPPAAGPSPKLLKPSPKKLEVKTDSMPSISSTAQFEEVKK